jgi:transposase
MHNPQKVYLVTGFTDMRKSINGLSIIVSDSLSLDPLSQAWFVFCNKQRNKLKILFWDTNGFWLYYRRLEQGRFQWPTSATDLSAISIEQRQLQWLLSGLPVTSVTRHQTLSGLSVM